MEMKRCPYCAFADTMENITADKSNRYEYAVMCQNCGARGPNEVSEARAIEMWNMRREQDINDSVWAGINNRGS